MEHHPGWDLTFSAPKSVSIVWSSADAKLRKDFEVAQDKAVHSALAFLNETAGFTRTGKKGVNVTKTDLVFATFQHSSNRYEEPQLHTHSLLFNIGKSPIDSRWRTIHPRPIYRAYMAAGNIYKSELAARLQGLGFSIIRTKDSFDIKGVPERACDAQSTASQNIEKQLEATGLSRENSTSNAREILNLEARRGKEKVVRDFDRWREENRQNGFSPKRIEKIRSRHQRMERSGVNSHIKLCQRTLEKIITERSTFNIYDLYRGIAEENIGKFSAKDILATVTTAKQKGLLIELGKNEHKETRYTTPEMLRLERENVELVDRRQNEGRHQVFQSDIDNVINSFSTGEKPITPEQAMVVRHITESSNGVVFVEGDAGTGKSFVMKVVKNIYQKTNTKVYGAAFTNKAAQELQTSADLDDCRSVDSLLYRAKNSPDAIKKGSVLILDEAGMIDSRKMNKLLKIAEQFRLKVISVGDEKQIQPILAGQMHGSLKRLFTSSRLSEVFRQKEKWQKQAVTAFAKGNIKESLKMFHKADQVKILSTREFARKTLVSDWFKHIDAVSREYPMITATKNVEVDELNILAREKLIKAKMLRRGFKVRTMHGEISLARGDKIVFTGNAKRLGILNSSLATVKSVNPLTLKVKAERDDGKSIEFDVNKFKEFKLGYAITTHKSQGSTTDKVFALFDGFNMDREKGYVAMSRGREANFLYADKVTLGKLSFEEKQMLNSMDKGDRKVAEEELFVDKLGSMLSRSHRKDTSQDYSK